ncbi:MAG TPA: IS1595 family transposase, partial [Flavobacterium sp.]
YALKIKDFSTKLLSKIFDKHISKEAKITTDQWKGYRPIAKDYNITQIPSKQGINFKALHTMIHQVKTWIRTTYSWVSEANMERYFNEFCYRINRSQSKNTIFNNLIKKMVKADMITHRQIIGS